MLLYSPFQRLLIKYSSGFCKASPGRPRRGSDSPELVRACSGMPVAEAMLSAVADC